jgi:hypothetical protein
VLTLKRLVVRFCETLVEAVLLGLAIVFLFGYDENTFAKSFALSVTGIFMFSFTTGYLFTTLLARSVWRVRQVWSYSGMAVTLFLTHSVYFFVVIRGPLTLLPLSIMAVGSCIVFFCTLAGTRALRDWAATPNTSVVAEVGN